MFHKQMTRAFLLTWFVFAMMNTGVAAEPRNFVAGSGPNAPLIAIPNARQPFPGILTGGQPTAEQIEEAKARGYKTIVNLQGNEEAGVSEEAAKARELGIGYVSIPIASGKDLSLEKAHELAAIVGKRENYPILIHCKSGNRVGALFALDAGTAGKAGIDEAITIGLSAGLTRLEPVVREILKKQGREE